MLWCDGLVCIFCLERSVLVLIDVSELSAYEEKHHSEKELGCSQNIRVGTK